MVRAPVDETEVVPVPPKAAVLAERLVVEALPVVSEPEVTRPLAVSVVMPLKAPLVTSQESEAMLMVSPPSPMVKEPVVVQVEPEEMVLLPIVPPETVMASSMPPSPREPERVGAKVSVSPLPVMVRTEVSPLKAAVEVARVTVGPSAVWLAGPMAVTAEAPEKMQVPSTAKQPSARVMPLPKVEVPVVTLRALVCTPAEKVEVALPCTVKKPVVVAPPLMVRPPAWVPLPIVEDAFEMSPAVNCMSVEVELPIEVGVKGKAKRLAEVT